MPAFVSMLVANTMYSIIRGDYDVFVASIIRVIYRFNRSRTLRVGIRAWFVTSGPKPGELPVVFEWYIELPSILVVLFCCCSYLLVSFVV